MSLKLLPEGTVKLIGSTQVITSVSSAVKELIENSIDAGATSINIRLENHGLDTIEVKDDGTGIRSEDVPVMCRKSYTSKISDFSDLEKLVSYGFRGEALNSLCTIAKVSVTTKSQTEEVGKTYLFNSEGNVVDAKLSHIVKGTIITIEGLFKNLPVRRQFLSTGKRKNEEIKKIEATVKALGTVHPGLRVSLVHNKFLIWQKNKVSTLRQALVQSFPPSLVNQLHDLNFEDEDIKLEMLIPKKECNIGALCHGTQSEAVHLYINLRPVKDKHIEKAILEEIELYFGSYLPDKKHPMCLASLKLPPSSLDVNLEPNKTKVLVKDLDSLTGKIKNQILSYYLGDKVIPHVNQREELDKARKKEAESDDSDLEDVAVKRKSDDVKTLPDIVPGEQKSPEPKRQKRTHDEVEKEKNISDFLDGVLVRMNLEKMKQEEVPPVTPRESVEIISDDLSVSEDKETDFEEVTPSQWSRGEVFIGNGRAEPNRVLGLELVESPESDVSSQDRSVSSQMGCKEMSAFTKFAREMRSTITAQNPGISFTKVASELASKWRNLQEEEKDEYERKSKEEKKAKQERKSKPSEVSSPSTPSPSLRSFLKTKKTLKSGITMNALEAAYDKRLKKEEALHLEIVGELKEGLACCRMGSDVSVVSLHRVQEALCFYHNLAEMTVPSLPCKAEHTILECDLPDPLWNLLSTMDTAHCSDGKELISDEKLTKNGFHLEVIGDNLEQAFVVRQVPSHLECFTLDDLKEVLQLIKEQGILGDLQDSRPLKNVSFIRSETMIQLAKVNAMVGSPRALERIRYWWSKARKYSENCPHCNPVIKTICSCL